MENLIYKALRKAWRWLRRQREMRRMRKDVRGVFDYDCGRWLQWQRNGLQSDSTGEALLGWIMEMHHSVERAICLPDMRHGFGQERLKTLMGAVELYEQRFPGARPSGIKAVCEVLAEYRQLHKELEYSFPKEFEERLDSFLESHPCTPSCQPHMTPATYWAHTQAPFDEFARSRHSLRAFKKGVRVPMEPVWEALKLTNETFPSACNRRQVRVHVVSTPELVTQVCELQKGCAGFGDRIDKIIIVSGCMRAEASVERNDLYTNCGIYVMNLCYALHFHKVAHCCLNWSKKPEDDMALRRLLHLPDDEVVGLLIGLGVEEDAFRCTISPKRTMEEMVTTH